MMNKFLDSIFQRRGRKHRDDNRMLINRREEEENIPKTFITFSRE